MLAGWSSLRLGEVSLKIGSGATPRGGSEVYGEAGPFALIRSQNIHNDGFHRDGLAFIGAEHAAELANVEVLKDDVLLNITGDSVARVCQVDRGILPARVNQHVAIIRPDPNKLNPRYLRYFLVSPEVQAMLLSWAGAGGTRSALTKGMIESFSVLAPDDIAEQCAIAEILGALDDKIELNRRMSETLEAMARALFRSWFVDADAGGEGSLGDVVELLREGENPLASPAAAFHHYSIPAFDDGRMPKLEFGETIRSTKLRVPAGAVLLSKLNPEIERVWLVDIQPQDRAVCSTEFLVMLPRHPFGRAFVYCLTRSEAFRSLLESLVTGTSKSHQRVHADAVCALSVPWPPLERVTQFERIAEGLLARVLLCRRESYVLSSLRDALLPKLISGELHA